MDIRLPRPVTATSPAPRRAVAVLVVLMLTLPSLAAMASTGGAREGAEGALAADSPDEWLTFKGDDQRTGVAASEAPSVDRVLWETQYKGSVIYSSPTVWNGTVYLGVSGSIRAIWAKNGTERWVYTAPNPIHTAPVIYDGIIYAGVNDFSGRGAVAVNAVTGKEVWNASIPDFVTSAPLVIGNNVYVGCQNNRLYCLRRSDGGERWNFTAERAILYGSIATDGDLLFFGIESDTDDNGKVYAVEASTGQESWNRSVLGSVWSSPAVAGGRVLVSTAADKSVGIDSRKGFVYAFNSTTGSQAWRTRDFGMVMASPSVQSGRVYVGSFGKVINDIEFITPQMYCLDLADGDILWNQTVSHLSDNAKVWSSVTIAGSKIIFGDELGFLNVWNIYGVKIWEHELRKGAAVKTTPAVAGDMVFAANTMGDVYGFGSQPDLSVNASSIELDDEYPHLGQRVNVRARITNIGDKAATGRVFLYNGTLEDWSTVIGQTTVTLEPGKFTYVHAVWTADELGNRAVWVRIMNVVPNEEDEGNNEALRVIEVLPTAEGWLSARAHPNGTGFMATAPPENNLTNWLRAEGASPGMGLVASMETVFYPVGQRLVALNRLDGTVEWSKDLGAMATTPPGIGDGAVFIGTDEGTLIALDLEDGSVRFERLLEGEVTAGPVVDGTMVLVGTRNGTSTGTLFALDTFDGSVLWNRSMAAAVHAHPALSGGVVYALSDNGAVLAVNASSGGLLWQYPVGNAPNKSLTAAPLVEGDRLYVASTSGFVYCLDADPSDGVDEGKVDPEDSDYDVVWTYKQQDLLPFIRSPVIVDGRLVLLTGTTGVLALDATSGNISWSVDLPEAGPLTMEPIAVNGSVVVGGKGVHILTAEAGVSAWTYEGTASAFVSNPAAVDGMLFVVDGRGILFAFGKVKNQPPVARIGSPPTDSQFRINGSITFDGSTSSDDKPLLDTSFRWDFGDGNVSLGRVTSHRFIEDGSYTVRLTVTDVDGDSDNTSITVRILGNHDPVLDWWDVDPDQGYSVWDSFNFSVRYTDPDNDPPVYVTLLLVDEPDYTPMNMMPVDPSDDDYTDGSIYFIVIQPLASRPYPNVFFAASDGISSTSLGVNGPVVLMQRTFPNTVGDIQVVADYVGPNNLQYLPVTSPPSTFPPGLYPIGLYVELLLETTFLKSSNISINYTIHNIGDIDVETLAVYRWSVSGTDAGWEYIEDSAVDTVTGTVRAPIPSLQNDIYTVLGNKLNPPPNHKPVPVIKVDGETYGPGANVRKTYHPGDVIEFDGGNSYDPDSEELRDYIAYHGWAFGDGTSAEGKVSKHDFKGSNKYAVTLTVRDSFGEENTVVVYINVRAEGESNLLYLVVVVGIIVILILLFFPKGGGTKAEAKPGAKPSVKQEPKDAAPPSGDRPAAMNGEVPPSEMTELDSLIDEMEEDRSA